MLQLNNNFLISSLSHSNPPRYPTSKPPLPSSLVLLTRLPSFTFLQSTSLKAAHQSRQSFILSQSLETALQTPLDAFPTSPPDPTHERGTSEEEAFQKILVKGKGVGGGGKRYEAWHVLRALEKKDVMLLMEIRNQQFELLVGVVGGSTPLVHAMRLGKSHRDIAILLTGAISRRVNDLTDSDLSTSTLSTKFLLKSIRANLKLAISYGLQTSQTDLLASYLQVIIMSEGDKFIKESAWKVGLALRGVGGGGRGVREAEEVMGKWVSRELKKGEIAAVGEYLANAVGDLVLMGMWNLATDSVKGESIPTYFFARDDRITNALAERITLMKQQATYEKLSKTLKRQLEIGVRVMGMRSVGGKERVELLRKELGGN